MGEKSEKANIAGFGDRHVQTVFPQTIEGRALSNFR